MIKDICRELSVLVYKEQYSPRILYILPYLFAQPLFRGVYYYSHLEMRIVRCGELDCLDQGYIPSKLQSHGLELGSLAVEPDS